MADELKHTPLVQAILRENIKHRLSVRRTFSKYEMIMTTNSEQALGSARNKIAHDLAKHIIPKLELKSEEDPFMEGVVMRGQVYVFSKSEFEELVNDIESQVMKSLGPRFSWGDDT